MITDKLTTPCGVISVLKNHQPIFFEVNNAQYNSMCIDDDASGKEITVQPDGCVEITIDTQEFAIGDKIACILDQDILSNDGGGEKLLNTTGQQNGFNIALGAPDTDDYEYSWDKTKLSPDMNLTKRCLCYTCEHCMGGFEFSIVDNPKLYNDRPYRKSILITVTWCNSEKPYAYDIVSFLTC